MPRRAITRFLIDLEILPESLVRIEKNA